MNNFTFGNYDPSITDGAFQNGSYPTNVEGESGAKKQLSYPLKELKEYINSITNIKDDAVIRIRITDDNLIQYSLDGEEWLDTASGGHQIFDEIGNQMPQKTKLMFVNANVHNQDEYTVVEGIVGDTGVGVSSIVQVQESSVSGGINIWRATLTNGNTYDFVVTNGAKGEDGERGEMGRGLIILGTYASLEDLQHAHPVGNEGDVYIVGTAPDSNPAYVWDTSDEAWESIGKIRGEKGAKGDTGDIGAPGTGIQSIVETSSTSASGGQNIWTVTLTNGATNTFSVYNGEAGAAGEGMKTGGTTGQILAKASNLDYDTDWTALKTINGESLMGNGNIAINPEWGNITGTISSQTDLNNALGGKANKQAVNSNISVSVTPTSLLDYEDWDTTETYGYKAEVTVSGLTSSSLIDNIVMSDVLANSVAPICETDTNTLRFFTKTNTVLSGTIFVLVTSEV